MAVVNLRRFWTRTARDVARAMARRLRRGRGLGGRFLSAKVRPNGRPLGYGRSRQGVPGMLATPRTRVLASGFALRYRRPAGRGQVGWFHRGRPGRQVPRPVAGLSRTERREIRRGARREAARQINRALRR